MKNLTGKSVQETYEIIRNDSNRSLKNYHIFKSSIELSIRDRHTKFKINGYKYVRL